MKNFKIDKSGKSKAFFFKKIFPHVSNQIIKNLIKEYKKSNADVRVCLHNNKGSQLQCMINLIVKKKVSTALSSGFRRILFFYQK